MGTFALCIENATRDIHSLLTLHRVHPQVRTDIQRILGGLLRQRYADMTVFHSAELADSPEQVCRAIVTKIVDNTFTTAIPAADIHALKRQCMHLEEEKDLLEAEVAKAEAQVTDTQNVLRDLKEAHDYMLHSYFREVLMLRSRIDDLQRQNRAYRAQTAAVAAANTTVINNNSSNNAAFSTSMASQLQQFVFNNSTSGPSGTPRRGGSGTSKRLGIEEAFAAETATSNETSGHYNASSSAASHNRTGKADEASLSFSATNAFTEPRRGGAANAAGDDSSEGREATLPGSPTQPPLATTPALRTASPSPRGKDRSVRIASPFTRGPTMTVQTTMTAEVVPSTEMESVDAIFDYEQYVRLLNGERGSWTRRFVSAMSEPDGGSARRRRRSLRVRTRSYSDVQLRNGETATDAEGALALASGDSPQQPEPTSVKGFQFLLHLALEPVQHKLHAELNKLRQAVYAMQKAHARDVQALGRALSSVQSRNDGLLDFLDTYVQETKRTIAVLARDSRAHTITDLLSSGALPAEKSETISTFFTQNAPLSIGAAASPTPPPPLTQLAAIVGADSGVGSAEKDAAASATAMAHPRKEWRLKPDARLTAETRSAAMKAMNRRLARPDAAKSTSMSAAAAAAAPAVTATAPDAGNAENYYRADLGLPYWSAHPITTHAQETFHELQEVAKEMRVTRVQQLYAFEEAMAAQSEDGRHVKIDARKETGGNTNNINNVTGSGNAGNPARSRRGTSTTAASSPPPPPTAAERSSESFYGPLADVGPPRPRKRLQDGWRTKKVVRGDDATAEDLLRELLHLRMRRACDQIRLSRAQDSILRAFYPELAGEAGGAGVGGPAMWTRRGKQAGKVGKKIKFAELPPVTFTSAEDVLKHRALQRVRGDTQKRITSTSQRIAELQRLLEMHFAENEVQEVVDLASLEAAQRITEEEAAGLYRVNGELKRTSQLWKSPYLNDANGPGGVAYLPIGLASTVDAQGRVSGGAGACVVLGDTAISAAPYAGTATATKPNAPRNTGGAGPQVDGFNEAEDGAETPPLEARNTPFVAVMDYCRGVQLGRPVGVRGGPVYVFQDAETGDYYVGDANGRPVLTPSSEDGVDGGGTAAGTASSPVDAEGRRPPLAMTRILFPAPMPASSSTSSTIAAAATTGGEEGVNGAAAPSPVASPTGPPNFLASATPAVTRALQPLYLVPMAVPLSDADAVVREGWQACHRHGHTRQDPIFYTTTSPLPLSSSYHHLVPQPGETNTLARVAEGQEMGGATTNKYLRDPPRVFQPADEATAMVQVRAVRLQSRSTMDASATTAAWESTTSATAADRVSKSYTGTTAPGAASTAKVHSSAPASRVATHAGVSCAMSDVSTNPGITASPAETATVFSSNSVRPSPRPLEPIRDGCGETPLMTSASETAGAAAAAATSSPCTSGQRNAASAPAPASLTLRADATGKNGEDTSFARTLSATTGETTHNVDSSTALAMTTPAPNMTAAVLLAKQQRAARLAREAEAAALRKAQQQEAWQQRAETRLPTKKEEFLRLPHLSPLPAHSAESPLSLLPSAANSARLQRQMRPEQYSLSPPPPSSRRTESTKRALNDWNLKDDA